MSGSPQYAISVQINWYGGGVSPRSVFQAGVIEWREKDTYGAFVLKAAHDQGLHVLERAYENDRIFHQTLLDRRDVLKEALVKHQSIIGLAPVLAEIGALPITVYQLETVLRRAVSSAHDSKQGGNHV